MTPAPTITTSYTLRALDSLDEGLVKPGLTPLAQHKVAQHG